MTSKICDNCKWYRPWLDFDGRGNCLNPINDTLYKHFNSSTGDYINNIRRSEEVIALDTCGNYEQLKKKADK